MKENNAVKVSLNDLGQDFTSLYILNGIIIDAQPFQGDMWSGIEAKIEGDTLYFHLDNKTIPLLYNVEKVEKIEGSLLEGIEAGIKRIKNEDRFNADNNYAWGYRSIERLQSKVSNTDTLKQSKKTLNDEFNAIQALSDLSECDPEDQMSIWSVEVAIFDKDDMNTMIDSKIIYVCADSQMCASDNAEDLAKDYIPIDQFTTTDVVAVSILSNDEVSDLKNEISPEK